MNTKQKIQVNVQGKVYEVLYWIDSWSGKHWCYANDLDRVFRLENYQDYGYTHGGEIYRSITRALHDMNF